MVDELRSAGTEGEISDKLLGRCTHLLEVQRDEMKDIVVHMERGRYPALSECPSATIGLLYCVLRTQGR